MALVEADGHGFIEQDVLLPGEAADEMLLMGLRLNEGLDLGRLQRLGSVRPSSAALDELMSLGLVESVPGQSTPVLPDRIRATGRGRFILNELVLRLSASFVPHFEPNILQPVA